MTAKEYLRQYEVATKRIRRLEQELEEERLLIDAVHSLSDLDGLPHGTNISRPVEERAIRLADKLAELVEARLDAIELRRQVFDVVIKVDGVPGEVLFYKYIKLMKWDEVCSAINYSWGSTHHYHRLGLISVSEMLDEKTV